MSFWQKALSKAGTLAKDLVKLDEPAEETNETEQEEIKEKERNTKKMSDQNQITSSKTQDSQKADPSRKINDPLTVDVSAKKASNDQTSKETASDKLRTKGANSAEFKQMLEEKDRMIEKFTEEVEVLNAEKIGALELVEKLKKKLSALQQEKEKVEANNLSLQTKISQVVSQEKEQPKHSPEEFLRKDIVLPKSENLSEYIQEYMNQYRTEFYSKVIDNLNQDIVYQIKNQEGEIPEDARDLITQWITKPEAAKDIDQVLPNEKLIQPLYNESTLKEQIEVLKQKNVKLKNEKSDLEKKVTQLESEITQEKNEFAKFKEDTDLSYQKYADEVIKYEQDIEELKDQINKSTEEMKEKDQLIQNLIKAQNENQEQIIMLEGKVKQENSQKEDLAQKYQVMVDGMKDFEVTIAEIHNENQELNNQVNQLKNSLANEKNKMKEFENSMTKGLRDGLLAKLNKLNVFNKEINFEQMILPKLIYENDRVTNNSFYMAVEDSLQMFIEDTTKKLSSESEEKRIKDKEKYETLSKNAIKLQTELKEIRKREKDLILFKDKLKEENEELLVKFETSATLLSQNTTKIGQLQQTINDFLENERRHLDEINTKNKEIEQLRTQLSTLQGENTEKNNRLIRLETELNAIPELTTQMETHALEMSNLREIIEAKTAENEALNLSIVSLQNLVDENQEVQERLLGQYDSELKKLSQKLEEASKKSQLYDQEKEKFEILFKNINSYEERIRELDLRLRESEQEKNNVMHQAGELVKKAKTEALNKENIIDRRVITTFLIKYFDVNASFPVKLQILETLSSILNFSEEDRVKIGLHRKRLETQMSKQAEIDSSYFNETGSTDTNAGSEGQATPGKSGSLTKMFMNFLLDKEDKEEKK